MASKKLLFMSKTQEIIAVKESLYMIKEHVDFHKIFASIFSACTTFILKIRSQTN